VVLNSLTIVMILILSFMDKLSDIKIQKFKGLTITMKIYAKNYAGITFFYSKLEFLMGEWTFKKAKIHLINL
jgi:hypothetical protein